MDKVKSGRLFAYTTKYKPGIQRQEEQLMGTELAVVQLGETTISTRSITTVQWTVPKNTISPELSMQLLNLLYTDPELMNLLSYGVEGVHYVRKEDGFLTNVEGKENPFVSNAWQVPNQFLTDVWEENIPDIWEEMRSFNEAAEKTTDYMFRFDPSGCYSTYLAVEEVYRRYAAVLENGMVPCEEGIARMQKELETAGIDLLIEQVKLQWEESGL